VYETDEDIAALQRLLDDSYARAGEHLRSIHTPERRVHAPDLVEVLRGVRVIDLATVTARCEPRVGPVDGIFYRGRFWFGSAHESVRFRHIRRRPHVSASHVVGETFAVIVHGTAVEVDVKAPEHAGFRHALLDVYPGWDDWYPQGAPYARIDAARMFAYAFTPEVLTELRGPGRAG
jgi:uncharacterized pyridoxamine 5'-phosphate oxidase family protein